MYKSISSFVSAKQLSKRDVRKFYDLFASRPVNSQSLPDDHEKFDGDGIALTIDGGLRGLYTYRAFASLQADINLYYPYGGMLSADRYTIRHRELIQTLSSQLKTDTKTQIIICLDHQPVQVISETAEGHEFWLALGFSQLDLQVLYQGKVNVDHPQKLSNFLVATYSGGDRAINAELCELYREAYKKRQGIPDVTAESIDRQLAIPECAYLIMQHNSALIGQVTLFIADKECYVDSIFVKRKYWGTGAADVLTRSLFAYAKNHDCETISGVAASNNWGSQRLMERFGLVAQHQTIRMVLTL